MEKIQKRIGLEIRRLDHMLSRNLSACVKAAGLDEVTLMHGWILRYLYENRDKEVFQKDLEKNFSVGRSTVTNIIKLMEKKGFLCRESVEKDARLKRVLLTEKGISTHEQIEDMIDELNEKTLSGISAEELEAFEQTMNKIKENIRRQQKERMPGKEDTDDQNAS